MEIYFRVSARQCGNKFMIEFLTIDQVRDFLKSFIDVPTYLRIKDVSITRCYLSFDYAPENVSLEDVLFHWDSDPDTLPFA